MGRSPPWFGCWQTLGGRVLARHDLIDALTVELPVVQLALVVRLPGVLSVSLDSPVASEPIVDIGPAESHLAETLGLPDSGLLGSAPDGRGIGVGVIDSGLSANGAYQIRRFVDFTRPSNGKPYTEYAQPTDDYGHGTHVAGLIAGNGVGSNGKYRGVAPGAVLVGLKVLDASGAGRTSDVLSAIEYAVTNRDALGLRVLNLSLGHPIFEPSDRDPLVLAVEAAARSGLIVVVSAGNFGCLPQTTRCGYAGITSPGNAPSAITVGSLDTRNTTSRLDDEIPSYSSRGPSWYEGYAKPDIVAPGHRLVSTIGPASTLGRDTTRREQSAGPTLSYSRLSGTSMATAVASGAVALVLDASERGSQPGPRQADTEHRQGAPRVHVVRRHGRGRTDAGCGRAQRRRRDRTRRPDRSDDRSRRAVGHERAGSRHADRQRAASMDTAVRVGRPLRFR